MSRDKHRSIYSSSGSSSSSRTRSVEERRDKRARRERRRLSSDESDSASNTSEESSTSSSSSSSSESPRRKRRRRDQKRICKQHHSKGREKKRRHTKRTDRHRHKKSAERHCRSKEDSKTHHRGIEQVSLVAKFHTSGPPFPHAPVAGLHVTMQEFFEQYIYPSGIERKSRERRSAARAATRPPALQIAESAGNATERGHGPLDTTSRRREMAISEAAVRPALVSYARAVSDTPRQGRERSPSVVEESVSISEYLSREFRVRIDDLGSVFHTQLDKVKELLVGKRVRGDPVHYPHGGVSFIVEDVTQEAPEKLSAFHVPGAVNTVASHFQRRGIKLKHPKTWPCLVERGGRVSVKRRNKIIEPQNHINYYPLEVLQLDADDEKKTTTDHYDVLGLEM